MSVVHKKRIFLVYPYFSKFIEKDLFLLKKHFEVRQVYYKGVRSIPRMIFGIKWADLTYSWFADIHAFFAVLISKIFQKKTIVIVGGYEVANVPELNYGLLVSPFRARFVKFIFNRSDQIFPVESNLKKEAIERLGIKGENVKTLPTGYDSTKFKPDGEKRKLVLTVFGCSSWMRVRLKGLDTFIEAARILPHVNFLMVGIGEEILNEIRKKSPSNAQFLSPLSPSELLLYYQQAKVYCMLSFREGLPNTLCEAMLCECVPVATDIPGNRTAIGNTGFYVPYGDAEKTAAAITISLESEKGKLARERIKEMFPLFEREKRLTYHINKLLGC